MRRVVRVFNVMCVWWAALFQIATGTGVQQIQDLFMTKKPVFGVRRVHAGYFTPPLNDGTEVKTIPRQFFDELTE